MSRRLKLTLFPLLFIAAAVFAGGSVGFGAPFTALTVTPTDTTVGNNTTYAVSFQIATNFPANGRIEVSFPAGFDVSNVVFVSSTTIDGGFTIDTTGNPVVVFNRDGTGSLYAPGANLDISFAVVSNSTSIGPHNVPVETQTNVGAQIDNGSDNVTLTPVTVA